MWENYLAIFKNFFIFILYIMEQELKQALSMLKTHMTKLTTTMTASPSGDSDVDTMTNKLTGLMTTLMNQLEYRMNQLEYRMNQPNMPSTYNNPPTALTNFGMAAGAEAYQCLLCNRPCPAGDGVCGLCSGSY